MTASQHSTRGVFFGFVSSAFQCAAAGKRHKPNVYRPSLLNLTTSVLRVRWQGYHKPNNYVDSVVLPLDDPEPRNLKKVLNQDLPSSEIKRHNTEINSTSTSTSTNITSNKNGVRNRDCVTHKRSGHRVHPSQKNEQRKHNQAEELRESSTQKCALADPRASAKGDISTNHEQRPQNSGLSSKYLGNDMPHVVRDVRVLGE